MDDPLRPSDEAFKQYYERGYATWYTHYQQALSSAQYAPHPDLGHAISQHPRFPSRIELDQENSRFLNVTGYSTWGTTIDGSCPLAPFKSKYTFQISINRPTVISLAPEPRFGFTKWFRNKDNHLILLTLAWAYVFSARWAEIVPGASVNYTKNQASYRGGTGPLPTESLLVDLGNISSDALRWWAAVLSPGEGWDAVAVSHNRRFKSPWSTAYQSSRHFILCTQNTLNLFSGTPASFSNATKFISNYVAYHNVAQQSHAAFMAALMLPTSQVTKKQVLLPTPQLSIAAKPVPLSHHQNESQPWGKDEAQLDRLLTLSCNAQGVIALLSSTFIEPFIPCNACGAWIQGAFAVLTLSDAQDPHILLHMLINRSPQLSFLWFGGLLTGIQDSIMKQARAALFRIDLQVAAWTNTTISFIQSPLTLPIPVPTEISRSDEARLMFLSQADFHELPPIVPFEPFGKTAVKDCLLEVQIHTKCRSSHGLYLASWAWNHENTTNNSTPAMPMKQAISLDTPVDNITIDFNNLDREKDCSETVTRSMFLWLRGEDGYPPTEREIYKHEWIDGWESDDEDAPPEGDGRSSRPNRVRSWLLGMTKRQPSI